MAIEHCSLGIEYNRETEVKDMATGKTGISIIRDTRKKIAEKKRQPCSTERQ